MHSLNLSRKMVSLQKAARVPEGFCPNAAVMGTRGQAFAASPHGGRAPALRSCAVAPELFRAEAEANWRAIAYARVSSPD
ncbi:Resolvase/invertase-type recombinase catalytic domain-containing protein [Candidatus Methylacidiphilum fumarolicum]|uniref:Resolvase/invertase-type recombinase catalytic domain-containing protein n=1 Tax=Candidatus Methylacidiphilum fumarolicum TaxID=591154 RepID=A0ABM9IEB3_9BACT|nr:Resolvase/invertase-type recombinase catalytic domain-containing protein [Candidatus Methylacidiphilum fumarolicum]